MTEYNITKRDINKAIRILKRHRRWQVLRKRDTTSTDSLLSDMEDLRNSAK